MSDRKQYYVIDKRAEVRKTFWDVALDFLRPQLYLAHIDMFPDLSWNGVVTLTGDEILAYNFLRSVW